MEGDLLGREGIEVEETGIGTKVLTDIEGGLTGYGSTLVRLPDRGGTAVLKGYANRADDIRFTAGIGGGAGGGGILVLDRKSVV